MSPEDAEPPADARADYVFVRQARRGLTGLVLASVWGALLAAWIWLDAALWLIILVALFTLPAVRDLIANPSAGLTVTAHHMTWHTDRFDGALTLSEIDHIRLDTRMDFSVRATAVLRTGRRIRLPFEATPPHRDFEAEMQARGIAVKRFHFQLMQ
jgi:hypothetical protein